VSDSNETWQDGADPDRPITEQERRATAKLVMRLLGAILAVVIAGAFAALLSRDSGGDDASGGDDDVVLINAIGPLQGLELGNYIAARQKDLAALTSRRAAVVSFTSYVNEAEARRLLEPVAVDALMVAAPGGKSTLVREELSAWAATTRAEAAEERGQFEELLTKGGYDPRTDKDFIDDAKLQIDRLTRLEKAVTPDGAVVFGGLVVGDAGTLKRLATTNGVRLVDVGAEVKVPEDNRVRGVRPEETVTAGDPLTRPA
jgi:hypothetical protein